MLLRFLKRCSIDSETNITSHGDGVQNQVRKTKLFCTCTSAAISSAEVLIEVFKRVSEKAFPFLNFYLTSLHSLTRQKQTTGAMCTKRETVYMLSRDRKGPKDVLNLNCSLSPKHLAVCCTALKFMINMTSMEKLCVVESGL